MYPWDPYYLFSSTCCIIWILIDILIAAWVYKDAERRGMNGILWVIIFLIAGVIGLLIYLIVREPLPPQGYQPTPQVIKEKEIIKEVVKVKCPYCGALVDQGVDRCPNCGAPLR